MKREILFRAQRVDNKAWVEGDLIHGVGNKTGKIYILPIKENLAYLEGCHPLDGYDVIPETVGQLWMSINKQKLFDGDVFEIKKYNARWVVRYIKEEYKFCIAHPEELEFKHIYPWQSPSYEWFKEFGCEIEIIGNIYDNT